jgi:PHD/YefM family antitoxin component YafN of YafNO toxin-antitoxin module
MESTTPKKLRSKLKEYLDLAKKEIIRIKRRSGQRYVLMNEDKFHELKTELHTLQKRLLGKSHGNENVKEKAKNKTAEKKITVKKATTKKASKKAVKKN